MCVWGGGGGPTAFKRSEVIPFRKTKTIFTDLPLPKTKTISTDLNDYRSISVLSILTKLLERYIHKHERPIWKHVIFSILFNLAYDVGIGCQTAVTRLTDTWLSAFNNRQISGAVFLDFRKAFDLV